jgi:UDP-N-acetylmuramate--alanine ligase
VHLPPKETLPLGDYFDGEDADHVPRDAGVLIYSPAVPEINAERLRARELGIPQLSYPEALALVTRPYHTIAVSGTHGKSTTTALLGKLFEAGGLDASVIVGAETLGWDHNLRVGQSDLFIVEACEYRRNMMHLTPQAIVLTNLELDHPDYYQDLADIKSAFRDYVEKLGGNGLLVINNDDANIRDAVRGFDGVVVRYGLAGGADLGVRNIRQEGNEQSFDIAWKGTPLGTFTTNLPGLYNIYNILAAVATYLSHRGSVEVIQKTLSDFHGVARRFEIVGMLGNTTIIADYAHHPTALRAVVEATASRYAGKRVLVVFRPHHRERTEKLFDQFVMVLAQIPHTLLLEIYDVAGREEERRVSASDLVRAVHERTPNADIVYAKDLDEGERVARARAHEFDVILVIGAGDADELAKRLVQQEHI